MKSFKAEKSKVNTKAIKSVFFGALTGALVTILLMLLCTFILMNMGALPDEPVGYIVLGILGVGALTGGYTSSRIYKSNGALFGAVTGLSICLIIFLAGIGNFSGFTLMSLYKVIVTLAFAVLGGIIGVNKKKKIKF